MKRLLLFSVLSIFCLTISAQTKTWIGASGGNYSISSNWNPAGVPGASNDVIIPTNSNMIMDVPANIKSFTFQGNATVTTANHIAFTNASSIAAGATFTWSAGIMGGSGVLTNNGTINLTGNVSPSIGNSVSLINNGSINFDSTSAGLYLGFGNPILNNTASGVINLNSDSSISFQQGVGTVINSGLIRRQQSSGLFIIDANFQNNDGTISVETGTLRLNNGNSMLTDGIYNVTTGSTLELANGFTFLGTLTGQLNGQINWTGNLTVATATEAILDFNGPTGVNWTSGFFGGNGTLTNRGILNFVSVNGKSISGLSELKNEGTINHNDTGALSIGFGTPTFNNTTLGVINLNSDSSITFQQGVGTLVNEGLIRRQQSSGLFIIDSQFQNNDGTISVESGTLRLSNGNSMLTDGTYNVTNGNTLEWANGFTLLGTLTGQLDGQINWTGNLTVNTATEAILDFNGPTGVNWTSGFFSGDGTLTNLGILNLVSSTDKSVAGQSILKNEGTIDHNGTGTLSLGFGSPTLNNTTSGVINLNADSSINFQQGIGTVINSGLIKKEQSAGTFFLSANTNNISPGKIICENGLLNFGNYEGNGLIGGNGSVQMLNSTTFGGTIAPGSSPGTLTSVGNYTSSSAAILSMELNGPNAGTDYDVFEVQGSAILDGALNVVIGFVANLDDEFVILTSPNITSCNLPPSLTAHYNNHDYTFDVICNPDNVTLKVTNIILGKEENNLEQISMYPNPSNGHFTIDLGKKYIEVTVQIYNMLGQLISSKKYTSAKTIEKEITGAAGIYFVRVSTAKEGSNILRIIKQ